MPSLELEAGGTALAIKAWQGGNSTVIYNRNKEQADYMNKEHKNPLYLKHIILPHDVHATSDLGQAIKGADILLLVVPSPYVRETLLSCAPYIASHTHIVCCAKGLEKKSGLRMSQVMVETVGAYTNNMAILSGPNHAEEIADNLPATTVVASHVLDCAMTVQGALNSDTFRVYKNSDVIGVELGGTTKNIIALATGIAHGLGLGDNCKAALLTRGLHEMTRFGMHFGAQRETYAGLAGMGDLIATCMSPHSRNRTAGIQLAKGESAEQITKGTNMVVEGFNAVLAVSEMAKKHAIPMPITEALYDVINGEITSHEALHQLMTRSVKDEMEIPLS